MKKQLRRTPSGYWSKWTRQLKKISGGTAFGATLLLAGGLYSTNTQAQAVSAYAFTASSGTYTPLGATATALPSAFIGDETVSGAIPLGFTFNYAGTNYTNIYASSNGFLSFNSAIVAEYVNSPSGSSASTRPLIAPLWDDHAGYTSDGAAASYETTGATGSRVFTFEWKNWAWDYNAPGAVISFQAKLYEATGKIEFHYKQETSAINSGSASIGLTETATGSGNYLTLSDASTSPTASSATATTSIATKPATGQVYTFTKPVATDISATVLASPGTIGCFGPNQTVSISVKNTGTTALDFTTNPLTLTASATGTNPATFTPVVVNTGTLAPGATQNVVVSTTYNMTTAGNYTFNALASITGDGFAGNNTLPAQTRTIAASASLPQTVNFTGFTGTNLTTLFPNWMEAAGATTPTGTSSGWEIATGLGSIGNVTAKVNLYTTGINQEEWIVGPKVTPTTGTFLLLKTAITDWGNLNPDADGMTGTDDKVQVMVSTNCGMTFTPIFTFDASNSATMTNVLTEKQVSLAAYAGQPIVIAIFATGGTVNDAADYDFHIDDLSINNIPAVDLGATALASPVAFNGCYGSTRSVSATIKNLGSAPLDFTANPATVTVNVTGAITQSLSPVMLTNNSINSGNPLAVGASINVPVGTLNMSALGAYTFNATASVTGDGNTANNAMSAATITVAAPVAGTANATMTSICQSGATTLNVTGSSGGDVQWQQSTSATGPFTNISGATSASFTTPTLTQSAYYKAVISCGTSSVTTNMVTVAVNNPAITASAGATVCGSGPVTLSATPSAGANISWYSAATGGTPLASGTTYSPTVSATTPYYAEASTGVTEKVGKMSTNGADGTNTGGGLIFNASAPFTLDSVVVYSALTSSSTLTVNLTDAVGTVLQTATVTLPGVTTRTAIVVPLNFNVPAGTGLRLIQGTSLALYRDYSTTAGISYPYNSPSSLATITDGTLAGYYYFFYRWSISTKCKATTRTAVIATVTPGPAAPTITAGGATTFCTGGSVVLTGASAVTGATYQWSLNGTAIPTATTSTFTANAAGSYTVTATTGSCNSTSVATTITVNPTPATPTVTRSGNTLTSSATSGNQWYLNGTPISGATAKTYTSTANGAYTVIATVGGCSSAASAVVNITNTGMADNLTGMNVNVYPNPNNGTFNVKLTGHQKDASIALYSLTGQLIATESVKAGQEVKQMNIDNLAAGTYLLKVISDKGVQVHKLIVE